MATTPRACVPADFVRSKYNNTGSEIAAHVFVMLDTTEDYVKLPTATTDPLYGVTLAAIPNGEWGDIQITGRAQCLSLGALATPGILLMSDATGKVAAWSAGAGTNAQVAGLLETTAGGADVVVEVELAGPGVINQG